jgi:predicted small lipoprotein YifL
LYVTRRIGDFVVINNYRPTRSGWALIVLGAAALALGGCGRKGPLDLPSTAHSSTANGPVATAPTDTEAEQAKQPTVFNPTYGSDAAPAAAKGRKKPFVLDPVLD